MQQAKRQQKAKTPSRRPAAGEQLDLIDVEPENSKEINRVAKLYKRTVSERAATLVREVELKAKLLAVVKAANIAANADGEYRFRAGDAIVTVTPRDELVQVKFEAKDSAKKKDGKPKKSAEANRPLRLADRSDE